MRITLSIDDDVLAAVRAISSADRTSMGKVISSLARRSLRSASPNNATRNGIPLLPPRSDSAQVSPELVHDLQDELQ